MMPELFPRVDVRHMDLHDGHGQDRKGVTDAVAVVRPCTGVDDHTVELFQKGLVDALAHRTFAVGLEAHDFDAQLLAELLQVIVDFGQRDRPVLSRIALAEHVVVDAVQHQEFLHFISSRRYLRSTSSTTRVVRAPDSPVDGHTPGPFSSATMLSISGW
jgi:hypothetical protein